MPSGKESRLIIAKLVLKMMQHYSVAIFDDQHFGRNAQDIIILLGVAVGTHEGKPMTAAKLAEYVCIPRPTIVRRVARMVGSGLLTMNDKKQIQLSETTIERASNTAPFLNKNVIIRTAAFLSKLDTKPIAP